MAGAANSKILLKKKLGEAVPNSSLEYMLQEAKVRYNKQGSVRFRHSAYTWNLYEMM
jgi:hypothetical protein